MLNTQDLPRVDRRTGEPFTVRLTRAWPPVPLTSGVNMPMTDPSRMRRHLAAALVLAAILSIAPIASAVTRGELAGNTAAAAAPARHRPAVCPIPWWRGSRFVRKLIVCAANHWHVPGGPARAVSIAWRESRFFPHAYNPSGAEGIYQHLRRYWPGRAAAYGYAGTSAFNARANILVTMKMVRRLGNWSPWRG